MEDTITEEREEVMIPHCGGNPTVRIAHFLKPTFTSIQHDPSPPLHLSPNPISYKIKKSHFILSKKPPMEKWRAWVSRLKPKFQKMWKKAGIFEPILASTYEIPDDKELILGLAEKWCNDTNSFIFTWGEVTITLEDMIILGGLSVLGSPFFSPLLANDLIDNFHSMKKVHKKIRKAKSAPVHTNSWMDYYMDSGDSQEHEAFLVLWLSSFVLVGSYDYIAVQLFPIAIHLSRGTRIALAPAVLASIYREMSLLKNSMLKSVVLGGNASSNGGLRFTCHAPLRLVQMWAWERLPKCRPTPNVLRRGVPRSARWHNVKILAIEDVTLALDSSNDCFLWRPYVKTPTNCMHNKLYREREQWILVESNVSLEIDSFVRCLRVSKLVGVNSIEQYLPHRVAMQFGLDQDLPACVTQTNEDFETAWEYYNRPMITGVKLYIPPRFFQADVSTRYSDWWRNCIQMQRSAENQQVTQTMEHVEDDTNVTNARLVEGTSVGDRCEKGSNVDVDDDDELLMEPTEDGAVTRADPPLLNVIDVDEIESDEGEPREVQQLELECRISKLEKFVDSVMKRRKMCYVGKRKT